MMRRYVRAVRQAVRADAPDSFEAATPWLEWAERRIAELDPLTDLDCLLTELAGSEGCEREPSIGAGQGEEEP